MNIQKIKQLIVSYGNQQYQVGRSYTADPTDIDLYLENAREILREIIEELEEN